ncbi:MAG: phosphoribosylanthranilate isomerase [Clostridiales bacterium]|jgi:phosphoribosylanthranilate isomerase|nr:phosphoribosylanthranilate isomerase [Clostridiales bacterium]
MNNIIVQIYGIRSVEDARGVVDLGARHIGVSYGKIKGTPGQLSCEQAKEIFEKVQPDAVRVGLTVSEDIDVITEDLLETLPQVLHLSGDIDGISPRRAAELRERFPMLKIMQAIPVLPGAPREEQKAFEYIRMYEPVADFFLIDTKIPAASDIGATGVAHDWEIDRDLVKSTRVPCIIAGGLTAGNVARAAETARPYGVDSYSLTNLDNPSGTNVKDMAKVKAFVEAAQNARL